MHITLYGRHAHEACQIDRDTALWAAEAVLHSAGLTPATAEADYQRQWAGSDDETHMTGAALVWVNARKAAEDAVTRGWANARAEVYCTLEA